MCRKFGLPLAYEQWDQEALYQLWPMTKKPIRTSLKWWLFQSWGKQRFIRSLFQEMKDFRKGIMSYEIFNSRNLWTSSFNRHQSCRPSFIWDINKEAQTSTRWLWSLIARMKIEPGRDHIRVPSPAWPQEVSLQIVTNLDHQKWLEIMNVEPVSKREKKKNLRKITKPRLVMPILVGGIKYRFDDLRNSLERSSAH